MAPSGNATRATNPMSGSHLRRNAAREFRGPPATEPPGVPLVMLVQALFSRSSFDPRRRDPELELPAGVALFSSELSTCQLMLSLMAGSRFPGEVESCTTV